MNKYLKYTAIGLGGFVLLLAVIIAIIAVTFNPNDYKSQIVQLVLEKKQRTLKIEGDIKLAFWPKLGADLGKVALSEHKGDKEFAAMNSARVFLSIMPLLKKELVIDTIRIDGVRANIVRYQDGTTNFDDLMSKEESQDIKFDIDGVVVSNAAVNLTDEIGKRHFTLDKISLKTGHIAKGEPVDVDAQLHVVGDSPKLDANLQLKGSLLADTENKHYLAKGLDATLNGVVENFTGLDLKVSGNVNAKPEANEFLVDGFKLVVKGDMQGQLLNVNLEAPKLVAQRDQVSGKEVRLDFSRTQGDDTFSTKLIIADLQGSTKAFQSSGVSGEISGKQGARTVAGKFSSPFTGNLETRVFDLPKLVGNVDIKDPKLPNGAAKASFDLNAHVNAKQETVAVSLLASVDGSNLKGNVAVAGFKQSRVKFNLSADKLDLNKLLGTKNPKPEKTAASKPADLSALKTVLAQGTINIGALLYDKYQVSNLLATVKADGNTLMVSPFSAKVDDSQIKGSLGISHFDRPLYIFDLDIDRVNADRYLTSDAGAKPQENKAKDGRPADLSALKALNASGSLRIGSLKYGKTQSSNIRIDVKADGQKLEANPFSAKVDDSNIKASLGISHFDAPIYTFKVDIDKLDADRYITKSESKSASDAPLDLSALKTLNASGEAKLGWLKLANVKTSNVHLGLKAASGQVALAPFSADLYQGSMAGSLNVDARSTPVINFKQDMRNVAVGPLLVDAINNNMLDGKGTVKIDVKTQGNTVGALKKALNGNAALNLVDGAIKGIDIAGTVRDVKNKLNVFKPQSNLGADQRKRTEFSEMTASFKITNGVAHNDDLNMKAPLFRITGSGDIGIGDETINYLAKPTVVKTLKGQGGAELDALNGLTIPLRITGTFSAPKYNLDLAGISAALAKNQLLGKVGGEKGATIQKLLGGDKAGALEGLLGGKKSPPASAPTGDSAQPAPQQKPATLEDQARKKLNKLLGF
jgi:AsmA protein